MIKIKNVQQPLKREVVNQLISAIKRDPDVVFISRYKWSGYKDMYVVEQNKQFIGCCILKFYEDWIKLGPLVLLPQARGKGIGTKLVCKMEHDLKDTNLFCTSTNTRIHKILDSLGFEEIEPKRSPCKIRSILLKEFLEYLSFRSVFEGIRKWISLPRREKRKYYIRQRY
ncbi:GNAT family N-acetyltransferase [Candidatus Dojkabacteria bacterium]|uniref:GNAT family N-acetyltransferase n=1 Tax=Candidatus Dojkabacteria bacterium TaxID=2099670 RepID=A0A955L7L6_9BACT|nr:GNAT family N-acetyltransferase [Candidatus Dojkabacteria bacterium]